MRFLPCIQTGKPRFWYICGGIVMFLGVTFLVTAIVLKTALFDSVKRGIYSMRFIDNTHEVEGCKNIVLGDATCSGKRFEAWAMKSNEKYATCMMNSAPSSKAKAAASKWCSASNDEGCSKPSICKPGQFYDYYFFSVRNPIEVLAGHPVELIEMEPVRIRKSIDRVDINTDDLAEFGTISWNEAYRYELADGVDDSLLDQEVILPHPPLFATTMTNTARISADSVLYVTAAATFYAVFQAKIDNMTVELDRLGLQYRALFAGESQLNFATIVKDQYRSGSFSLVLGRLLASPACPLLIPLLVSAMGSPIPPEVSVGTMCGAAFLNNIGLSAFAAMTKPAGLATTPGDAAFFYEFQKHCIEHSQFPGNACYLADVCPFPAGSTEYQACVEPMLTETDVDALFELFSNFADPERINPELVMSLLGSCTVQGHLLAPQRKCDLVREQLVRAGRMAVASSNNPKYKDWMNAFGWKRGNILDTEIGKKVFPYFIKGTIRDLMGLGLSKPNRDPLTKSPLGPQLLVNSLHANGTTTDFTYGPISLKLGSQHGPDVAGTFASVKGKKYGCAFDYGCMAQQTFADSDGENCVPEENACVPTIVENGHDAGFFAGKIFGSQKGVGKTLEMFMPEMMMGGIFEKKESNVKWINGLLVDKWDLVSIPAMERRNCDNHALGASRALACDSPVGTLDVGYQVAIDAPAPLSPLFVHPPMTASFPHFGKAEEYLQSGKLRITPCKSCPAVRDFKTQMYTEPETGAQVLGNQKMQVNVHVSSKASKVSRKPGTSGTDIFTGKLFMAENLDVIVPMFWMSRFDQAAPFQAAKLASLQSLPKTLNIICGVLIALAVLLAGTSVWMLRRGKLLAKAKQNISQATLTRKRSSKSVACTTDEDGQLSSFSQETSPRPLSTV